MRAFVQSSHSLRINMEGPANQHGTHKADSLSPKLAGFVFHVDLESPSSTSLWHGNTRAPECFRAANPIIEEQKLGRMFPLLIVE